MSDILFGIDSFLQQPQYKNQQWGLVTNDVVMTRDLVPVRQALIQKDFKIKYLFSPEHGIAAMGADGAAMDNRKDSLTGLPIFSLYGNNLRPTPSVLSELDGIIFDLPDIGVRFYTYIWTLSHIMEACNESKTPLIILDRPNPISGNFSLVEGPMLDENKAASFIGRWSIPIRHSLTIGELATFWIKERGLTDLNCTIIPVKNWSRNQFFNELNYPFIPTSPAISSIETLLTYPALCFMEGLNISEGRGTAFPFRVCGAPWIKSNELNDAFNELKLEGVKARIFSFIPSEGLYKNQDCQGIMLHVTNPTHFKPIKTGLHLVALLKKLYPQNVQWANYPTHVNKTGERHLDLLAGTPSVRALLEKDWAIFNEQIVPLTEVPGWHKKVEPFLIYSQIVK